MQKIILFVAFIFISVVACKKDSTPAASNYYMKATINGTQQTFTKNAKATEFFGDFTNSLTLSADNPGDPAYNNPAISLILSHAFSDIKPGTYLQGVPDTAADVFSIFGTYQSYLAGLNNQANPLLKITITQINSETITGTFEGEYFDTTLMQPAIVLRNGQFYLPFK